MNGGIEHPAEAGRIDGPTVHAESDDATRELVHDDEAPVAPQHDGLAAKEVDAPEAICLVSDERQPRGPGSARGWTVVLQQDAMDDVLVDVDPERLRDDPRNPRAPESRIARFELDDRSDERLARPLWARLLRARARRKQAAVLAAYQRLMERHHCGRAHPDGDLADPSGTQKERPESAEEPIAHTEVRRTLSRAAQHDQLLFE